MAKIYDTIAVVEVFRRPAIEGVRPIELDVLEEYASMFYAHAAVEHPEIRAQVERICGPDMEFREVPESSFENYEIVFFIKKTPRGFRCWDLIVDEDDETALRELKILERLYP
jgi:hypothetical protein